MEKKAMTVSIYAKYGIYFDPLNPDTNGNGILDGDEVFGQSKQQEVSTHDEAITEIKVDMNTNGNLERNLTIKSMYNIDVMSTNVYSLIGEPFNFETPTSFKSVTITFKVDKSKLGDTKFDNLLILWYDEENQIFKEMETIHDEANSTVSTTTTHFSQYMIVDSEKWYANWEASFNELRKMWIGNTSYQRNMHTIFMVDCSSSMRRTDYSSPVLVVGYKGVTEENIETIRDKINGNADINAYCVNWCKRARICHNIINNKGGNDTAAIIRFSNTVISDSGLSYNKSYLNDQLPNINNGSGTANLNNALNAALSHVETDTTDVYRLVVITDNNINFGQISSSDFPGNVILNIVNLGSNDIGYGLEEVAHATGGDVYDVVSASDLTYESGGMVYVPPKFIGEDYDEDGIPDLVELYGLKPNGQPINTSMYLKDTDGDGIPDNIELKYYNEQLTSAVTYEQYLASVYCGSDPAKKDTDGDGVWDNKDPLPNDYGISCNLKPSDRNSLLSEIDSQISADIDLVRWGFQLPYNSVSDCIDIIYDYDNVITKLSNKYMIPKAAIQAVLLRELKCFWAQDDFSDSCVLSYYAYQYQVEYYNSLEWWQQILIQYPEYPIMSREDASTGYGQIYALTAINANNWAIEEGIISGNKYDYDDWHQREEIWNKLRTDNTYNISMIPLVLMHGASKKGFDRNYYNYTVEQIKKMLAVYNGDDSYGEAVYHSYVIFDKYN